MFLLDRHSLIDSPELGTFLKYSGVQISRDVVHENRVLRFTTSLFIMIPA